MPALKVDRLSGFIALRPAGTAAELMALAGDCVTGLDVLRAPLEAGERTRQHAAGLTPRQDEICWSNGDIRSSSMSTAFT